MRQLRQITSNDTIMDSFYFVASVKNWDEKTYEAYQGDMKILEQFLMQQGMKPVLNNVSEKVIRDFLFEMGKGKASSTVRRYHGTINRIFKRLEREGIRNVMVDIDLPPLQHQPGRYLTYTECADILLFADELLENEEKDVRLTVRYMLYTGLRNDTLQHCRVSYLDIAQGVLHIPAEINKKSEPQILPLPTKLLAETENYIDTHKIQREDLLLPGLSGKSLGKRQLNRITDRMNAYFGWKDEKRVTPHVFRATLSTLLDDMGINGDIIDFILNHHPNSVREKHYSRSLARKIRETKLALDTFEAKIEGLYEKKKSQSVSTLEDTDVSNNNLENNQPPLQEVMTKTLMGMIQKNPEILFTITQQLMQDQSKKMK